MLLLTLAACRTQHDVTMHHKVDPIYLTVDVNVRVDRQLDQFFAFEDQFVPAATPAAPVQDQASPGGL
jgi:hypothetical protein